MSKIPFAANPDERAVSTGATPRRTLVLASTSSYRRALLSRLGIAFETAAPDVDESELAGETPRQTALRLAEAKARAVASRFPDALIIGSDQVAHIGDRRFGKPLTHANAVRQLSEMSGQTVIFSTGLCLVDAASGTATTRLVENPVTFRRLTADQIENYLRREPAYDCAGSAKSEGLGVVLIARLGGDDPNALVGLPLIALCDMLAEHGVEIL